MFSKFTDDVLIACAELFELMSEGSDERMKRAAADLRHEVSLRAELAKIEDPK
jgi:hypothetical protein